MNDFEYHSGEFYDPDRISDKNSPTYNRRANDGDQYFDGATSNRDHRKPSQETDNPENIKRRRKPQGNSGTSDRKTKSTKSKPRRSWRENGFIKLLCDKRFHAVIGVAIVFFAVYITIAAISFIHSGAEDQSAITTMSVNDIARNDITIRNAAGPVGARLAQSVIVEGLGLGAIAIIVYLSLLGLSLMGLRKTGFWSLTFKALLVGISISIILGLISLWLGLEFNLGGYHGHYINLLLITYLDWIGAALISLFLIIAVFYVYINDLMRIYNGYRAMRNARRAKAEQARRQLEEDRERVRAAMAEADIDETVTPLDSSSPCQPQPQEPMSLGFKDMPDDIDNYGVEPQNIVSKTYETTPSAIDGMTKRHPDGTNHVTEIDPNPTTTEPGLDNDAFNGNDNNNTPAELSIPESANKNEALSMPGLDVVTNTIEKAQSADTSIYDPTAELSRYKLPGLDLLHDVPVKTNSVDRAEQEENKDRITKTLNDYGIAISHIQATVGPTVTLYEIIPAEGVRIAKIKRLEDDIAMSLAALGIRIIAPIPGKGTIGIEVPNKDPQTVSIRSILGSKKFQECKQQLPMAMGATISNEVYIADLCKMPHLLVAGATGMGKSVGLNTIIASLLYKKHPAELKFVLIDPKMVEFSLYSVLERHYLAKLPDEEDAVVTSMDKVLATLNSLCVEMDQRYMLLRDANVRSITEYNERFIEKRLNPEKGHRYLPYIVMIVDEFADLIMTAGKEVEKPIARIAQKARAVGMHMIIATQRPSTNVITGIIKANFPGRIAFRVSQMVDSKTILDRTGANQLIGRGDMLFSHNGSLDRVQCAFIDTSEVQAICNHIDQQVGYEHAYYLPEPVLENDSVSAGSLTDRDPLFEEAAELVVASGVASTSSLQRRYSIGYNRAGKIMDQLEAAGIVGPAQGGKPRQVLIDHMQLGSIIRTLD